MYGGAIDVGSVNPSTSIASQAGNERETVPTGIETNTPSDGALHGGIGSFGARGGATESLLVKTLREQVADLKAQNLMLQSLLDR